MMKKLILFVLFVIPLAGFSQTKNFSIDWQYAPTAAENLTRAKVKTNSEKSRTPSNIDSRKPKVKYSENALKRLQFSQSEDAFVFTEKWQDARPVDPASIKISNIRFANLTQQEQSKLVTKSFPTSPKYNINNVSARGNVSTVLRISPIINENGILKKILSFSASYTYKTVFRSKVNVPGISNSVLASGEWFKFRVAETGVQILTSTFLNNLGLNMSQINPQTIKIYGHGGQPLSLLNNQNRFFDLPETPIQILGIEDGSFDSGDSILFYGTNTEGYNGENDSHINPYADDSFYYITYGGLPGKRIIPLPEPTGAATVQITNYDDEQFFEEDVDNPGRLGRRWVGNRFDVNNEQTFDFDFSNANTGKPFTVDIHVAAVSDNDTFMNVTLNGTSVNPITIDDVNPFRPIFYSKVSYQVPASDNLSVVLSYNNSGNPSSVGYLDYIRVRGSRQLQIANEQFIFENLDVATQTGIGEYQLTNASQVTAIWDITDPFNIFSKENINNDIQFSFKAALGTRKRYIAVHSSDFHQPVQVADRMVSNQNLKGRVFQDAQGNFSDVDYIIVTSPFLLQPALRLANHHKNLNNLRVKVVTTDEIYEEFSSGKQDISAIRNFVRYVYNNASSDQDRIKYLCLFGDTSVDYKNRFSGNNNVVPTFHTLSSTSTISSFMSDDFFGSVDENEGAIGLSVNSPLINENGETITLDNDILDIAVGRIVADEVSLANAMVTKIINYSSETSLGNWRNNFTLISDDVDESWEFDSLQVTLDELGDEIELQKPFINVTKIHSDAFQQVSSAGGDRYPEVNDAIVESFEVGSLIVTYLGHGGEDGLAKEFIVTRQLSETVNNEFKYPCVVTVTCEFTKFDNPLRETAGEFMYWNETGGAISMVTTTRSISVRLGVDFNEALAAQLFGFGTDNVVPPAEALRLSKNEIGVDDDLRRVIFYIGDPAMSLAFPKPRITLTTVNGQPVENNTIVLEALSRVSLGGIITDEQGNLQTNYNGVLEAKVFDKKVQKSTLANDGVASTSGQLFFEFQVLGEGIFNGQASVTGGRFNFDFVVPRDIQIPVGAGRVSFYSKRSNTLEDDTGSSLDIQIGGLNENAPEDNVGPQIQLFMNDESFVNGSITNASPNLIAKLEDVNGINTASGIGHDMIAILDGDESNPFVLNDFYQAEVDDFTRGTTSYGFRDLEDGLHTITFKAWDVYNNSSTAEIQFIVAGDDIIKIDRVLNYPNPFVDYTEFWFEHNRPSEPLDVQVQIFTITGKIVKTINQQIVTTGNRSRDMIWDGRDDFGEKIGKGTYVYKITVKSTLTNKQVEKFEKLVIL